MKKIVISGAIIIAVLAGIMYVLNNNKAKNEEEIATVAEKNSNVAVNITEVDFKEVNNLYTANGTFAPRQEVMIGAETGGRVMKVLVDEGSYIRPGQTLAIINGDKQSVGISNAQAVYNNAVAEVARFEGAYASGGVTKQQLDQVKLQLENAKNNLKSAQLTASDVNVHASFGGVINKRMVEPGAYVGPGTQLFEVVDISTLKLNVNVDEKNIGNVRLGQKIKVVADVFPDQEFEGTVTFISPKANAGLNFTVEVEIKNNRNNELKAGMYGTAKFGSEQMVSALVVPREAFVGSISSNQIFVAKDGKAVLTEVVSGRSFGNYVEILSGINKGDKVITTGQINLTNGTAIEILK